MVAQHKSPMWPHQQRCVTEIAGFFRAGGQRLCVVCPTGGGKSRIGQEWEPDVVFVHTNELLRETRVKFPRSHCLTVQSSDRPPGKRILIDECHHYKAKTFGQIFETYADSLFLALTATPERGDGKPLDMFQGMIVAAQYSELLRAGFIVPCQTIMPGEPVDGLAMDPVEATLKYRQNRSGFVFCSRADQASDYARRLREAGVKAEAVASQWKRESSQALDAFRTGHLEILCCIDMISEGIDVPMASFGVLARSPGTVGGYLQRVGRILRASAGKRNARFVDLGGAVLEHGLPTEDRAYSLSGSAVQRKDCESVSNCAQCGACYLYRPTCPNCGFAAPVKPRQVKITPTQLREAEKDPARFLATLLKKRAAENKNWYWVVATYKKWFDCPPELGNVSESEKLAELERLKNEGRERGYKIGYAYARWNEIFG